MNNDWQQEQLSATTLEGRLMGSHAVEIGSIFPVVWRQRKEALARCNEFARKLAEAEREIKHLRSNASRYMFLRDCIRSAKGYINEQLYVACDSNTYGKWALDGEELDEAVDTAISLLSPEEQSSIYAETLL